MKSHKPSVLKSFDELQAYRNTLPSNGKSCDHSFPLNINPNITDEKQLFHAAMADVKPISKMKKYRMSPQTASKTYSPPVIDEEREALNKLNDLVENGKGFVVSDTPEYIEGRGYHVNPDVLKRLHRGDFSIQGYVDLHGYSAPGAWHVFENFLKDSINSGKRAVLIVHGRGLSSPSKPVLKTKVYQWLTSSTWRKWVIAFSSARACDGGAGATYVLLRERPYTKRYRKKNKLRHARPKTD